MRSRGLTSTWQVHSTWARHGERVSGAGTRGRLSFGMAASRGAGSRSPLEGTIEKEKRIRCWRCEGKCLVYGYAVPGDPKETWHACPTCEGKGWYVPVDPIQAALRQKTIDFFHDMGRRQRIRWPV
jgi:hypothetical protein